MKKIISILLTTSMLAGSAAMPFTAIAAETTPVTTITTSAVDDPIVQTAVVTVTIMDISGDNILVKPVDGSPELKSSSKFSLSAKQLPADINPKVGMKLEITYNGGILETYPAMFGNVQKVVEVKEDTVKEDPTLLKGTKDMTLNDIMRLAELGDELDWANFKDYKGRDVGSGLYIWEFTLEDDYVLDVGGTTDKKPLYILLSHDDDKGIDIRTNDVKEYIASTTVPVVNENEAVTYKIITPPDKTVYKLGEQIDLKGIEIEVTKGKKEPVVYTYPDVAFDYQSNIPKAATVLLHSDFRSDKAGTYKVSVTGAYDVYFTVNVVDDSIIKDISEPEEGEMIIPETENGKAVTEVFLQSNDNVKSLKIPATVNKVDIIKCLNLEKIEVSEDNPYLCSVDGVIYSKDMKTLVFYPSSKSGTAFIVSDTVEVIREGAFSYAQNLKTVKLPEGVKIIKDSAFFGTKITDFELPETLTDIEQYAFSENNSLTSITLPASLKHAESPFLECGALTEIVILHEIGDEHFESSGPRNPDDDYYSALLRNGSNITVFVPDNSYEDYNKYYKDRWKCKNILPLSKYEKNTIKGDANCDGQLDMADAVLIMQALANPNKYGIDGTAEHHLTEQGKLNGDMDGNGLTVGDAQAIQRKLLGLDDEEKSFSATLLGIDKAKVIGVKVTSLPEGYDYSFTDKNAQAVVDYLSNISLSTNLSVEDPGQLNGMTWVIKLNYENGDTVTLYDLGKFIHGEDHKWYEMTYEESQEFSNLVWKLGKTDNDKSIDNSAIAGKIFAYEKEGAGGYCTLSFSENGRFLYYPGKLSSYMDGGDWKIDGDTVSLIGMVDKTIYLKITDDTLVYIAEGSDEFPYMDIKDGEKFGIYRPEISSDKFQLNSQYSEYGLGDTKVELNLIAGELPEFCYVEDVRLYDENDNFIGIMSPAMDAAIWGYLVDCNVTEECSKTYYTLAKIRCGAKTYLDDVRSEITVNFKDTPAP